jgi:hypothetical protein
MVLGVRQIFALERLAEMPEGSKSKFSFMGDLDRSATSAASLFRQGLVLEKPRGMVTITQAGRDALSPPIDDPFGLGQKCRASPPR